MALYPWSPRFTETARFEMRVLPNTLPWVSPYTRSSQVIDLLGERWIMVVDLPPVGSDIEGAYREAYFDRLKGPAHQIELWNLKRPWPNGTLRDPVGVTWVNGLGAPLAWVNGSGAPLEWVAGGPAHAEPVAQLANTCNLQAQPGKTLLAGDHIGLGNGQNVRIMLDTVADGAGVMPIEFQPRARTAIAAFLPVRCHRPPVRMMLRAEGVPVVWQSGYAEGVSLELIEAP